MPRRYFSSDVEQITVPQTGHIHRRLSADERMSVDCEACDPFMARYGAVTNPDDVPLTYDERRQRDEQEHMAEKYMPAFARALSDGLVQVIQKGE